MISSPSDRSDRRWLQARLQFLLLLLAACGMAGCSGGGAADPSGTDPSGTDPSGRGKTAGGAATANPSIQSAASGASPANWEQWQVNYIDGAKVGYTRGVVETVDIDGQPRVRMTVEDDMEFQRFGQPTRLRVRSQSIQTLEGNLLSMESSVESGATRTTTRGEVQDGQLQLQIASQNAKRAIAWKDGWGGYLADALSLRQQPLKPQEKRTLTVLAPVLNLPSELTYQARSRETTALRDGATAELLKVEVTAKVGGTTIQSVVWVDAAGEVVKSHLPAQKMTSYRASKEAALAANNPAAFDLGQASVVKVARKLPEAHRTQRAVYQARLREDDPLKRFAQGLMQRVTRIDPHTVRIEVARFQPGGPTLNPSSVDSPASADDRAPNALIESDSRLIQEMARTAAGAETDPWKTVLALERHVHRLIDKKNFSQAFASAADVARTREGDCTEHSVLLAALCRARGVPCRVVIGLVYVPAERGFAYHMWNEVWIDQRWAPLDATLGGGDVGAGHLKITTSNLKGASPYAAFLPVLPLLRQLELEIREIR